MLYSCYIRSMLTIYSRFIVFLYSDKVNFFSVKEILRNTFSNFLINIEDVIFVR